MKKPSSTYYILSDPRPFFHKEFFNNINMSPSNNQHILAGDGEAENLIKNSKTSEKIITNVGPYSATAFCILGEQYHIGANQTRAVKNNGCPTLLGG